MERPKPHPIDIRVRGIAVYNNGVVVQLRSFFTTEFFVVGPRISIDLCFYRSSPLLGPIHPESFSCKEIVV